MKGLVVSRRHRVELQLLLQFSRSVSATRNNRKGINRPVEVKASSCQRFGTERNSRIRYRGAI